MGSPFGSLTGEDVQRIICSPSTDLISQVMKEFDREGIITFDDVSTFGPPVYREVNLTLRGWERYTAEQRGQVQSDFGFIAMKFFDARSEDPFGLPEFVNDIVKPAAKEATGYCLYDIRDFQQSGVIDNYLRTTIRDSAFVICDLTHDNNGAYWEAGYADALDKPVIYICEKSKFKDKQSHFDTNHCTTIVWEKDGDIQRLSSTTVIATLRRSLDLFD